MGAVSAFLSAGNRRKGTKDSGGLASDREFERQQDRERRERVRQRERNLKAKATGDIDGKPLFGISNRHLITRI